MWETSARLIQLGIMDRWLRLTPSQREAKRQAVRDREKYALGGEHVRPWTTRELAELKRKGKVA